MRRSHLTEIVLATRNRGKVKEICALLENLSVRIHSLDSFPDAPEVVEDEPTLKGNARKKAETIFLYTGRPALADDTGLEVTILDDQPGVFSARYAGPEEDPAANRKKLLAELGNARDRSARFRTVAAFVDQTGVRYFEGVCSGVIGFDERGEGGFGYDALFTPDGHNQTFAELPSEKKNEISHRGMALRKFAVFVRSDD